MLNLRNLLKMFLSKYSKNDAGYLKSIIDISKMCEVMNPHAFMDNKDENISSFRERERETFFANILSVYLPKDNRLVKESIPTIERVIDTLNTFEKQLNGMEVSDIARELHDIPRFLDKNDLNIFQIWANFIRLTLLKKSENTHSLKITAAFQECYV